MTNDSRIIATAFHELRQFCRDVALLLNTGEDIFQKHGWKTAQTKKTCLYSGSASLDWPNQWLPLRYFRCYSKPKYPKTLAFLAVVIELPRAREREDGVALLTAGALRYKKPGGWSKAPSARMTQLFRWHIFRADRDDSGEPTWQSTPFQWRDSLPKIWDKAIANIDSAVTLALPLHEISDAVELETRIIEPVLNALVEKSV